MKALTLVRHAKSGWSDPKLADFDRPLNERGQRDLPASARRFAATYPAPERILTSPAVRALATARGFADALGIGGDRMVEDRRIYGASHARLFTVLREQPETLDDLMLVGHSPGIADLAHALCGAPDGKFPTCAILRLRIADRRWADLGEGATANSSFSTPRSSRRWTEIEPAGPAAGMFLRGWARACCANGTTEHTEYTENTKRRNAGAARAANEQGRRLPGIVHGSRRSYTI